MDFKTQYLQAIKNEIALDPTGRGYAGQTTDQQALLLNSAYTIMIPQVQTPRIAVIIGGIPFTQNIIEGSMKWL